MRSHASEPATDARPRPGRRTRRRAAALLGLLAAAVLLSIGTAAWAYWSSSGTGTAATSTATLTPPSVTAHAATNSATVAVSWTASTTSGGRQAQGYYVSRISNSDSSTHAACGTSSTALTSSTSCSDTGVADGSYHYTVTAVYYSWSAASSPSGNVTVSVASKLVFTRQPSTTAAGTAINPAVTVTAQDSLGNAVAASGISVTVALGANPATGTLAGTLSHTTDATGVATFADLSITKAGAGYTLTAASSGLTGATSSSFTITPAAANRFVITTAPVSGQATSSATLGPITVQEQDAYGNAVTAPTGGTTVTLSSTSTGTTVFSASSGGTTTTSVVIPAGASSVAFYYGDTKAGGPVITTAGSLTSATQAETITAAAAAKLSFGQQPSTTAAGAAINPAVTVQVLDQYGNLTASTASVTVAIGSNPSAGTLSGTPTGSAAAGSATFSDLSINKAGAGYTLTAASSGLTGATSSSFTINAAAPASIAVSSGSPQATTTATAFGSPLVARVSDAYGNVVPGATVTFTAPASGASGTFANATRTTTATTNASGLATASTFTANATVGNYVVSAAATGAGSVSFTLANTSANVTLNPTSGHTGATVTLLGSGWVHNSTLTATFNGTAVTLANGTTTNSGQISTGCTFTVPTLPAGTYQVVVRDAAGRVGAANFTIN